MRNVFVRLAAVLFAFGAASTQAAAQQPPRARRPPPEVGVGFDRFFLTFGNDVVDSLHEPSAHLRVTLPFAPRFAFEGMGTIGRRGSEYRQQTEGLYFLQIRQRLRRDPRHPFPFITYGAVGYYSRVRQRDVQVPQQGGGVKTYPGFSYTETEAPFMTAFGAGFQEPVGPHVAVRVDAQLMTIVYVPFGFRLSAGVSIPFGRYSTN